MGVYHADARQPKDKLERRWGTSLISMLEGSGTLEGMGLESVGIQGRRQKGQEIR
jgi:hypothetical protein